MVVGQGAQGTWRLEKRVHELKMRFVAPLVGFEGNLSLEMFF